MSEDIKNYLILLALINLVDTYKVILEDANLELEEDDRIFFSQVIEKSTELITEMNPDKGEIKISRPVWK